MMRKKQLLDYINEFIEYGKIQGECMLSGDFRVGNKAFKKTEAILNIAKNDGDKEKFYTMILNTATDANTLTKCCAHMLRLSINEEMARQKLIDIAKDNTIHSILMSNAKLFLQEWDKGNIKPIRK